jgi:hypothetical protein
MKVVRDLALSIFINSKSYFLIILNCRIQDNEVIINEYDKFNTVKKIKKSVIM